MSNLVANPLAVHFAKRACDSDLDPVKILTALYILGGMLHDQTLLMKTPEVKPEFVWRNGAKVRTR
jgi:hypothetical protein